MLLRVATIVAVIYTGFGRSEHNALHRQTLGPFSVTGFCLACFWPPLSRHPQLQQHTVGHATRHATRREWNGK